MAAKKPGISMPTIKLDMRALLVVVVCIALSAGTYLLFTKPQRSQAADLANQVASADAMLRSNQQRIDDITNGKGTDAAASLKQAQTLDQQLPQGLDRVSLAATIPNLAQQHGVTVNQMDPVADTSPSSGNLKEFTFTMSVAGSVAAVTGFLTALQKDSPIVTVSGLALTISAGQATAAFSLHAYSEDSAPLSVPPAS